MNLFQYHQVKMLHQNLFSMINFVNLVIHFQTLLENLGFNSREKLNFQQQNTSKSTVAELDTKIFFRLGYIFFAHSVIQKLNLINQINIAMRKVTSNQLTVGILSSNSNEKLKEFFASEQACTFMNCIKEILEKDFCLIFWLQ